MKEKDQERALAMIDEDPGLHGLRHLRAPYLDMEVGGMLYEVLSGCASCCYPAAHSLRHLQAPHLDMEASWVCMWCLRCRCSCASAWTTPGF